MHPPEPLGQLLCQIRACAVCADHLELGPRPIVQAAPTARVLVIGQAPGRRVHESGVPWDDPSGRRLREWLGLTDHEFYDPGTVALVPMGFCFLGSTTSGDRPPRPECAPLWHARLLAALGDIRLTVLIGTYALARYLPGSGPRLTDTVAQWRQHLPDRAVLPHPSPRNRRWLASNPWFEDEAVPAIRSRVREVVDRDE